MTETLPDFESPAAPAAEQPVKKPRRKPQRRAVAKPARRGRPAGAKNKPKAAALPVSHANGSLPREAYQAIGLLMGLTPTQRETVYQVVATVSK